ncbi:hypothetical protein Droror1_Dr00001825 [Drosera rotundifolia]
MMDSIKPSNGYGQLELEQLQTDNHTHQPPPPRRRPLILLALAALLLLILLIVIIASTSHHHHHYIISPAEALSIVCNVTVHPDTCISSITQLESISGNTSNPNLILALSLQATLNSLENVMLTISTNLRSNNNETQVAELQSCDTSFDDLIHNLNFSISVIETISEGSNETLSGRELEYLGKLLGDMAAKQEECLRSVTWDAVAVIRDAMGNCSVMAGNSLAIVTNYSSVLERISGNVNAVGGNGRRLLVIGGRSGGPGGLVSGGGAVVDAGGRLMGLRIGKKQDEHMGEVVAIYDSHVILRY